MMFFYLFSSFLKLKNIIDQYKHDKSSCTFNIDKTGNIQGLSDDRNLSIMKTITELVIYQCLILNFMSPTAII